LMALCIEPILRTFNSAASWFENLRNKIDRLISSEGRTRKCDEE